MDVFSCVLYMCMIPVAYTQVFGVWRLIHIEPGSVGVCVGSHTRTAPLPGRGVGARMEHQGGLRVD